MTHDYLWNGSGEPDPEIQRLEHLLEPYRFDAGPREFPAVQAAGRSTLSRPGFSALRRAAGVALAIAAMVFAAVLLWIRTPVPSYEVARLAGSPRIGAVPLAAGGRLRRGEWLLTDGASRARILIGDIGEVEVGPGSRIGLLEARNAEHRLMLQRGVMRAMIWAPPGRFFVSTPSAQAIDLGCSYTLEVDEDGNGILRVTSGWVAFEHEGRESFVPAGAACLTRVGAGPGTPYREDASDRMRAALLSLDFGPADTSARAAELGAVLDSARKEDALTLWHMLGLHDRLERERVWDRLAQLVPPPSGVTREGVLDSNRAMLDLWWNELGLGDAQWWRPWEQPWPGWKHR